MPRSNASDCSSQSLLRSHVWQSPSCSERSSSTTVRRALADPLCIGTHVHPLNRRGDARSGQRLRAFDLNEAHSACADRLDVFQKAQRGDIYSGRARGFEHGRPFREFHGHIVYSQCRHFDDLSSKIKRTLRESRTAGSAALPFTAVCSLNTSSTSSKPFFRFSTESVFTVARSQATGSASGSNDVSTRFRSRQNAWEAPVRNRSIPAAARSPAATASTTEEGPEAASPPAKTHGIEVWPVTGSASINPFRVVLMPAVRSDGLHIERLADRGHYLVRVNDEFRFTFLFRTAAAAFVKLAELHAAALYSRNVTVFGDDFDRARPETRSVRLRASPPRSLLSRRASLRACGGRERSRCSRRAGAPSAPRRSPRCRRR